VSVGRAGRIAGLAFFGRIRRKHIYWALFIAHFFVVNEVLIRIVRHHLPLGNVIRFVDTSPREAFLSLEVQGRPWAEAARKELGPTQPFEEVDAFDEDAKSWGQFFSQMGSEGLLVFDANGDGRLDVYVCQDGQNWTRPTDANGVLEDRPRRMANVLYLNLGNDERGAPRFVQVGDLPGADRKELLIEGYLFPREHAGDSKDRPGRASDIAVAADFNGDGRPDILVGNAPSGMFWSHEKTRRILPQMADPVGRKMKQSKLPMAPFGQFLVQHEARSSLGDKRKSARGEEFEGANSLYLNLGDSDGDGIPEWEDASRRAGIEGFRHTSCFAVADFDLDGDLDIYAANLPDLDYWPSGSTKWSGAANCLYVNQLAETGELRFVERAGAMDVDGVYDDAFPMPDYYRLRRIPVLAVEYSFMFRKMEAYKPEYLVIDGVEAEHGQISHACVAQDVDGDGYPDLWVANDFGWLRLYRNEGGKRFRNTEHARSLRTGYWMSLGLADFNGDLHEDLFAGNLGGAIMNNAIVPYVPTDLFEPTLLQGTSASQFLNDRHDSTHAIIDGADFSRELGTQVQHSRVLPPDVALPNNYRREAYGRSISKESFDVSSLDPYEFAWGSPVIDVQNDGRPDLYWHGSLYLRGGGLFSILGTNPGRLLVNASDAGGALRFVDQTAEHRVFNILELRYDRLEQDGYIYRPAPRQNWGKRDMVYSYDRSVWASEGPRVQERVINQDLIQTAENGRAAIAADLNGDGAQDLLLRNKGGYDSRSSNARNLRFVYDGRPRVLPAHDNNYPSPTNFEPGKTRLLLNPYRRNHFLKVRLYDDREGALNRDAVGARVVLNGRWLRVRRAGDGNYASNVFAPLHFGMGSDVATTIEVTWPDRTRSVTRLALDGLADRTITVSHTRGLVK